MPIESKFFEIEISNPFFTGPSSITLYDQSKGPAGGRSGDAKGSDPTPKNRKGAAGDQQLARDNSQTDSNQNMLELTCNPTKPASYTCYVILKSLDRSDIRLYEYKLTAIPQKIKAQLEFRVPARGVVTQEIPIVNNSSQEWKVSAVLEQAKAQPYGPFSLPRPNILVRKGGGAEAFTLSFRPQWICQETGLLLLKNESTKEEYEYELKGIGEEPLAEDHIVLNCSARETTVHRFEIRNTSEKPQTYTVWTDLQNATGAREFTIKGGRDQVYNYDLKITPLLGGVYTASITF